MKPAPFRYRRVATVDEAVAALSGAPGARVLAGGQSLVAELCARTTNADVLVDIGRVTELDHIAIDADVVRIGALRRIAALETDAGLAEALPALVESAARIAHPAVRNRGTVGGNVAYADPASGIPPVLLAYDGEVVLSGPAGRRTVAAAEFFTGYRTTACGPDELLTELRFRRPGPRAGAAFREVSRRARGWGLAGACVVVELDAGAERVARLRIGLLGVAPTPVRAVRAEEAAVGRAPDAATLADVAAAAVADLTAVPTDVHASAALRRSLGGVVVRRALSEAVSRAAGA